MTSPTQKSPGIYEFYARNRGQRPNLGTKSAPGTPVTQERPRVLGSPCQERGLRPNTCSPYVHLPGPYEQANAQCNPSCQFTFLPKRVAGARGEALSGRPEDRGSQHRGFAVTGRRMPVPSPAFSISRPSSLSPNPTSRRSSKSLAGREEERKEEDEKKRQKKFYNCQDEVMVHAVGKNEIRFKYAKKEKEHL